MYAKYINKQQIKNVSLFNISLTKITIKLPIGTILVPISKYEIITDATKI